MFDALERLKHKIHNTRIPIKDKRLLFFVQCCYFVSPIVVGYAIMQYVMVKPEDLRKQIGAPDAATQAAIEAERRRLQAEFDAARMRREQQHAK